MTTAADERITRDLDDAIAVLTPEDALLASNIQHQTGTRDALLWATAHWLRRAGEQDTPAGRAVMLGMAKAYHRKWQTDQEGWWTR